MSIVENVGLQLPTDSPPHPSGYPSPFLSDFTQFGHGPLHPNNDLNSASSSLAQIDPIAARFGVVLPTNENHAVLLQSALAGGPSDSSSQGSTNTGS